MDTISAVVTEGLKLKEFITECSQLSIVTICQILWVSYTLVGFVTLKSYFYVKIVHKPHLYAFTQYSL